MRAQRVEVSLTEFPQFRRLVQFLEDVEGYAHLYDEDLAVLVEECRDDLASPWVEE